MKDYHVTLFTWGSRPWLLTADPPGLEESNSWLVKLASLRTGVERWDDSLNSIERDTLSLRESSPLTTRPEEELMRKGCQKRVPHVACNDGQ
jgi:hypothetical protein